MAEPSSSVVPQPPPIYPQATQSNTSSAPSSASFPSPLTPGIGVSSSRPASRPSSGSGALQSQHISLPPGSTPRSGGYSHSFYPAMSPSGATLPGYSVFGPPHTPFAGVPGMDAHAHVAAANMQSQKRAYRQRRKDPSCDACRERKVKCDATDSSSCTECSSRNVKCQFTKETNRRMSNIRHNQDLEKELAQAKSQVNQLRLMLDTGKTAQPAHNLVAQLPSPDPSRFSHHKFTRLPGPETARLRMMEDTPRHEQRRPKRRRTVGTIDLSKISSNMEKHGRGIFKPPCPYQRTSSPVPPSSTLPSLPPKEVADALIRQYHFTLHPTLPMIHWPSFQETYDAVYRANSLRSVPQIWAALLYAVFACGTLHRSWQDGKRYLEISRSLIDMWSENLTLDHARTALLNCIFLVEMNLKSAGWTWAGFAVRISFDIGLHCEAGAWSAIEEEMRRRLWWSIYTCDCLLSLELGRPSLMKEEDCDVGMPSPVDDQYMHAGNDWLSPTPEQATSPLLPTIQVIGGIAKLLRILKSHHLAKSALDAYDTHFKECIQEFPVHRQIRTNDYVDPIELPPIMYLQNARLMLHRHNLTPTSAAQDRSAALDHCASVAVNTATLLRRCMQDVPPESRSPITEKNDTWEKRMVSAVSAFFCTHIWRCALYLCFRLDFENAIWCARASATLGTSRPINTSCGRYLEFFLMVMVSKLREGNDFDTDEEMIAYASGDLQGSFENAWVWKRGDADFEVRFGSPGTLGKGDGRTDSGNNEADWDGWDNVLSLLDHLFQERQQEQQRRAIKASSLRPPSMLPPLAPSPNLASPSSRMSIKDLI